MSKYYTPDIEEFNPWFPFEFYKSLPKWKEGQTSGCTKLSVGEHTIVPGERTPWVIADSYQDFDDYDASGLGEVESMLKEGKIRVKYLDKEDIESLGFVMKDEDGFNSFLVKDGKYKICNMLKHNACNLNILKRKKQHYIGESKYSVVFTGDIKNKSELKKILKQIGV